MNTTFKDILDIFFRYLRYVIAFSVIVVGCTMIYVYGAKKVYTSKAQVLIRLGQEQMGSMQFMNNARNVYVTRREQELKNEEMIFLSDKVMTSAAKLILGDDAQDAEEMTAVKKYLADKLEVKALFESDTLSISFEFPNPYVAKKILDILVQKYIEHHIGVYENTKELSFVKYKLDESRKKYDESLQKYTAFIDSVQIYDEKQIEFLVDKSNKMRTDLSNAKADHEYHVQKLARAEEELRLLQPYEKYNSVEVLNDRRNKLKSKLNEANLEKQNLLQKYTPESRLVLDINKEIEMLQKLIKEEPERVVDTVDNRKNETYWNIDQTIIDLKTTIAGEAGRIASLSQELKNLEEELSRNAHDYQHLSLLKKDLDLAKVTYEKYYEGFLESDLSNMSKAEQVTNISIIEEPSLNVIPEWPSKKKVFLFASAFLVAGNFFLVMLLSMLSNTVTKPSDIVQQFGKQPLGTIPFELSPMKASDQKSIKSITNLVHGDSRDGGLSLSYYESNLKEFQRLYINMTLAGENEKVYLVGRSRPGEGGATITFNLAAFMAAYLGKRVAFVDYAASRVTASATGFQPTLDGSFEKAEIGKVDCYRSLPSKQFRHDDLREKYTPLDKLREEYDFVFCNVPPVKDSADLVFLNYHVDRILFFVEAERTKLQVVKHNIDTLVQYGFSKISFVLNKRLFYIPKSLYKYV